MTDALNGNNRDQLLQLAEALGCKIDATSDLETIKNAIRSTLGDYDSAVPEEVKQASREAREAQGRVTFDKILAGEAEVGGVDFTAKYPKGRIPKLLPRQIPWEGRRMRLRRIRQTEEDLKGLVLQWNGSTFLFPIDCPYADVPWPHYQILKASVGKRLKQRRRTGEDGRTEYVDEWVSVTSYPFVEMGVTPGTEHLPRSMKEYIFEMYLAGFPNFTASMWKMLTMAYDFSEKDLGIKPSMPLEQQIAARRSMLFDRLGLIDFGDGDDTLEDRKLHMSDLHRTSLADAA